MGVKYNLKLISKSVIFRAFPIFGILLALLVEKIIPNSKLHPAAVKPYYSILLLILLALTVVIFLISFFNKKLGESLEVKGPFFLGAAGVVILINLITAKFALLPIIFFPSFDNILAVFVNQTSLLGKCIWYSFRLLLLGVFWGITVGFITGVFLGFSRKVYYWINPYIKLIGPIPATAWIPLVLTTFPTPFGASVFIIALAVWFPVQLMTSSGIQNTSKVYFEVGRTLGAGTFFQVFRIAVPAAPAKHFSGNLQRNLCGFYSPYDRRNVRCKIWNRLVYKLPESNDDVRGRLCRPYYDCGFLYGDYHSPL